MLTPAAASGDGIRGSASGDGIHSSSAVAGVGSAWQWPIAPPRIVAPFVAPAHEYGPGHRGIDLAAPEGSDVHSPAPGVVAFAGSVAGRGVITVDHGDGLVSTFEPVVPGLAIGTVVDAGAVVGTVASGGHTPADAVHFGVREYGEYINPMLLLGGIERAVLLPCC
ncbi:MAG: peptidase M23 [Microbacterium sp. SCN 70-200]|nr:MAG: peptidase M23 [Microbacterium sp. SCN 70-200]OJV84203.1 MAG: peptidase M23 [Microbacterium sp. 70-16]